jgi:hypothetical protein
MQSREQTESNRQAIIRALMDEGLSREEATAEESRRFCRAMEAFMRSGRIVQRTHRGRIIPSATT